jgi:trans-AT polyketide synthase/acyltransferase/oxidoreductase domain-containing protein
VQHKGMGELMFARYPQLVSLANKTLGYSITSLCLEDPRNELNLTSFTQPAIYVVSYLSYLAAAEEGVSYDFLLGHSVGEYAALAAANVFDFETGLKIVQKRASIMAKAEGGGLVAVIGLSQEKIMDIILESTLEGIEIANINSPNQIVVGGFNNTLNSFVAYCSDKGIRAIKLKVSGAFHTSHMEKFREQFLLFLKQCEFKEPSTEVIANLTGQPHQFNEFPETLSRHIASPVQWVNCIEYLLSCTVDDFIELGTPAILTPMIKDIRSHYNDVSTLDEQTKKVSTNREAEKQELALKQIKTDFCKRFECSRPFVIGSLGNGAVGLDLISSIAPLRELGILDTEGVDLGTLDNILTQLSADKTIRGNFGVALTTNPNGIEHQYQQFKLFEKHDVSCIEISGQSIPSVAVCSFREKSKGRIRILARVNCLDSVKAFLNVADAICVDISTSDSANELTIMKVLEVLNHIEVLIKEQAFQSRPLIGVGGIAGSPYMVNAMLALGVDFVVGGSAFLTTHQACVAPEIKSMLKQVGYQQYQTLPDWKFPEFSTSSFCYVLDEIVAKQVSEFQELYLNPQGPNLKKIRSVITSISHSDSHVIQESFFDNNSAKDAIELRAQLRNQIFKKLFNKLIPGDLSLVLFNLWLSNTNEETKTTLSALDMIEMLCPKQAVNY